jgi:hypothetical protein
VPRELAALQHYFDREFLPLKLKQVALKTQFFAIYVARVGHFWRS